MNGDRQLTASIKDTGGRTHSEQTEGPAIPPAELTTAHLSDVARDHVTMSRQIAPVWSGSKIDGAPAMTIQVAPGDNQSLFEAIESAEQGQAIVVGGAGYLGRSLWGAIMSYAAMQRGVIGIVVDGLVRDKDDLERLGFPAFARGVTPIAPRPRRSGRINVPIMCGGIAVSPGDYIFGDADGVVVIAAEHRDEVLRAAWARARAEEEACQRLQAGQSITAIRASGLLKTPAAGDKEPT